MQAQAPLDALAERLARTIPVAKNAQEYVEEEVPLLDAATRAQLAERIDAARGPGLTFSGRDRIVPGGSGDVDLVGIGPIDLDALADQLATVSQLADDHRDERPAVADDLEGLENLLSCLLVRGRKAAGTF